MKISTLPGDFAFRALVPSCGHNLNAPRWTVSQEFFFTKEEAIAVYGADVKWPIEMQGDGIVYVPSVEELA